MSEKMEFVDRAMKRGARVSTLCREYGISRETGYTWINRFKKEGPEGLEERSRRPQGTPLATAEEVVAAILALREAYPRRGPKKLVVFLQRKFGANAPSVATVARVLKRFGMVRQRSRFPRGMSTVEHAPKVRAASPNEVWTVDLKGWWRARDTERCEPLTVRDAFSRFVLAVTVMQSTSLDGVRRAFDALFEKHGVPQAIQCDNGTPFINVNARGGLTRLSAWWVSLGIRVVRSRPGCPQDNGGHERMHRDMRADVQAFPASSRVAEQRACDRWRIEFNRVRPHEALGGKTPAEVYTNSVRRPRQTKVLYPSEWTVRTVPDSGTLEVGGVSIHAGLAVGRQRVALEPLGGTKHRLWFREVDLGEIDLPISNSIIDEVALAHMKRRLKRGPRR